MYTVISLKPLSTFLYVIRSIYATGAYDSIFYALLATSVGARAQLACGIDFRYQFINWPASVSGRDRVCLIVGRIVYELSSAIGRRGIAPAARIIIGIANVDQVTGAAF